MLNGELTPRSNLIGELTGGVFYGTNDYEELINKPSVNGVELVGNKTTSDLGIDIPTELSELTNDVGFITSADVPTKTSDLTNDSGYITSADISAVGLSGDYDDLTNKPTIPTLTSQLTNDSGFITNASVPTMTSQLFNDSGFITSADVPTKTSELENDSGFITSADVPTKTSELENDSGFVTSSDLAAVAISGDYDDLLNKPTIPENLSDLTDTTITTPSNADLLAYDSSTSKWVNTDLKGTASGSIATFSNGGDGIPVSEFECEIVAQQASGTPTPDNPLAITGFSQADIPVSGKNFFPSLDTETLNGFTVTNNNGVLTLSGTAGANTTFTKTFTLAKGSYNICALNGTADSSYRMELMNGATQIANAYLNSANRNVNFTLENTAELTFNFYVPYGKVGGNYTLSPQITLGSGAELTFKPYTGNLYTVSFGQTIYGGRLIYANGQWSIEATQKYFSYTEVLYYGTYGSDNANLYYMEIPNYTTEKIKNISNSTYEGALFSNMLSKISTVSVSDLKNNEIRTQGNSAPRYFYFRADSFASLADLNAVLANTPLQVVAELETPVIIPITSSTRVKTISGDNNIYSNTGDCELKYFTNKADSLAELIKAFL